tara:strand:- start:59 stop:460 length:402 start_codon:yes stop_codon:yes gene_type:complete
MKIHHIGIVCNKENINNFFFKPKKKFIYTDKNQNNKLIIGQNKFNNLWIEYVIPLNKHSTVENFLQKRGPSIHHFAYYVNNINDIRKKLDNKKGYLFVNSFRINLPCFGGVMDTVFYFNNNIFIEFLTKVKKK